MPTYALFFAIFDPMLFWRLSFDEMLFSKAIKAAEGEQS